MAKNPSPSAEMLRLIMARRISDLLYVAAKLEIADHLKDGPRTVEELAATAGAQAALLYRALRALASFGVFAEIEGKRFKLTPMGATLRKAIPGSMRAALLLNLSPYLEGAYPHLLHGVKTGEVPSVRAHGVPLFEYFKRRPEEFAIFNEAMTNVSSVENPAIAAGCNFSGFRTLVDVGGGHGSLLATILRANPKLKGVLFDLPEVTAGAKREGPLTVQGIDRRSSIESGNFFEVVPKGGDAYMMKRVLHDWTDEECAKILAKCREAMNPKGKVLVVDAVIPPGNGPDRGKLLDIQMLVVGGRERTRLEFAELFRKSGLKLTRVVPTKCQLSIVEGVRA